MQVNLIHTPDVLREMALHAGAVVICGTDARAALISQYLKGAGACVALHAVLGTPDCVMVYGIPAVSARDVPDKSALTILAASGGQDKPDAPADALFRMGFANVAVVPDAVCDALVGIVPVHLDFMCPGFAKCGTTTLQKVLEKNPECFLPPAKETFFFQWHEKTPDATRILRTRHFAKGAPNLRVGCIEPSHYNHAKDAFSYFGGDLKILFILRNPAEAEFSYFRMIARNLYKEKHLDLYKKCRRFGLEMFEMYINREVATGYDKRFTYDRWISEYLKYFSKENVKIVLFEDMLKNPGVVLSEIQSFLDLTPLPFNELPHANEGKAVSRGYLAARVNLGIFQIDDKLKSHPINRAIRFYQRFGKRAVFALTQKKDNTKLDSKTKAKLIVHFMPSIKRLEAIIGRSLEGVWY